VHKCPSNKASIPVASCTVRFRLPAHLWRKLQTALRRTNLPASAGDYLPSTPSPDSIVYTTTVGHSVVRTTDGFPFPHQLKPLLAALREALMLGERRLGSTAA
jgi:hypothetical protein